MGRVEPNDTPCYCINFQHIAADLTRFYDRAIEPSGLTINQFSLLFHMRKLGPCSRTDLAKFTRLERTTIVRNAGALISKGLAEETPGPTKRNSLLVLTEAGEQAVKSCMPAWQKAQEQTAAAIGPDSLERVRELARRVTGLNIEGAGAPQANSVSP